MSDNTGLSQSLVDLLEVETTEAGLPDWDISALADWPNFIPAVPALASPAEPQAGNA
ncbi:MAG: hypothetical protein R3D05_12590 [Dongiaceae bacterium]